MSGLVFLLHIQVFLLLHILEVELLLLEIYLQPQESKYSMWKYVTRGKVPNGKVVGGGNCF